MNFLITPAWGADAPAVAPQGGFGGSLFFMVALFAVFYFLLIRPQTKRAKEHKSMVDGIAKGDEVILGGGIAGKVTDAGQNFLTVEIADGVNVKVQRATVQSVLPKGTLKSV